jgi:hypothetical protein
VAPVTRIGRESELVDASVVMLSVSEMVDTGNYPECSTRFPATGKDYVT